MHVPFYCVLVCWRASWDGHDETLLLSFWVCADVVTYFLIQLN